ncbi:MAG: hypothetical protein WAT71_14740 [Ignavibacteria bacterium]
MKQNLQKTKPDGFGKYIIKFIFNLLNPSGFVPSKPDGFGKYIFKFIFNLLNPSGFEK